jgi:hypothetical protein
MALHIAQAKPQQVTWQIRGKEKSRREDEHSHPEPHHQQNLDERWLGQPHLPSRVAVVREMPIPPERLWNA